MPSTTQTETPPSPPTPNAAPSAPRPQKPTAGRTVDGRMTEFHWSDYAGANTYRLQISPTDSFESLHVDFTVEDTTVTELSGLLPIDGSTWYWRVRAEDIASDWSDPAAFTAGRSDEESAPGEKKQRDADKRKAAEASARAASTAKEPEGEAEVPFHTAQTSSKWVIIAAAVMVSSFIATVIAIAMAL
ncbi:MAG: hypothetical protein PPP56_11305 [Longimonas sp.]|uniref:hypothetical protein n=1 Tax=Longimonas sp. TaxID=2039626 RepID=UPI00335CCFCE